MEGECMRNLSLSVTDTIKSDLGGLADTFGELGIDFLLDEGLLKDVPIIGTLTSLVKLGLGIKEVFFLNKLLSFFNSIKDIPLDERNRFMDKYFYGKEEEFGARLTLTIERYDDIKKPKILANLFKAMCYEEINPSLYFRLSSIVETCFIDDLIFLKDFDSRELTIKECKRFEYLSLANHGLCTPSTISYGNITDPESGGAIYKLTEMGRLLQTYGLNEV